MKVELGDEVKDKVSGFRGIAVAMHQYLQGCVRISVQPPTDKDGKMADTAAFDEPQIEVIKKNVIVTDVKTTEKMTGGPGKYSDTGRGY